MPRKPNYNFEKRRKEEARKQKQEEKRARKHEGEKAPPADPSESAMPSDATVEPAPE